MCSCYFLYIYFTSSFSTLTSSLTVADLVLSHEFYMCVVVRNSIVFTKKISNSSNHHSVVHLKILTCSNIYTPIYPNISILYICINV